MRPRLNNKCAQTRTNSVCGFSVTAKTHSHKPSTHIPRSLARCTVRFDSSGPRSVSSAPLHHRVQQQQEIGSNVCARTAVPLRLPFTFGLLVRLVEHLHVLCGVLLRRFHVRRKRLLLDCELRREALPLGPTERTNACTKRMRHVWCAFVCLARRIAMAGDRECTSTRQRKVHGELTVFAAFRVLRPAAAFCSFREDFRSTQRNATEIDERVGGWWWWVPLTTVPVS